MSAAGTVQLRVEPRAATLPALRPGLRRDHERAHRAPPACRGFYDVRLSKVAVIIRRWRSWTVIK